MNIKLGNEYRIVTDDMQFIAQQMRITQEGRLTKEENIGKEVWKDIGYFPKVNQALQCVSKHILLVNDDLDIIITKLNLLDIKIEEIKELLENTRIKELIPLMARDQQEELEGSEDY